MRKLSGMLLVIILALVLVACGEEEDDAEPTEEATLPVVSTEVDEDTAIDDDEVATPSSLGTPDVAATPAIFASPIVDASPAASPVAAMSESGADAAAVPEDTSATPASGTLVATTLTGSVALPGVANETYVLSEDGCVGIGSYSGVEVGKQVVIRDATGAIIGVTELGASDVTDSCQWVFQLDVPESTFYSVEIPMVAQHVFTQEEVANANGEIELALD